MSMHVSTRSTFACIHLFVDVISSLDFSFQLLYEADSGQVGRLLVATDEEKTARNRRRTNLQYAPCFPLSSLLFAIKQTRVDYLSLDVEGLELEVLETIPWNELDIRILSVEYRHLRRGKQALINHMTSHGYRLYADLFASIPEQSLYVDDFIFVKE
jgi:hypothetical protein